MKAFVRMLCLILAVALVLPLVGCEFFKQKYTAYSFDYFDTVTTIVGYEYSRQAFDERVSEIEAQLSEYHKLYDIYTVYDGIENLAEINAVEKGSHKRLTVSDKIIDMLVYAKEVYDLTSGEVNVAMGSVLKLWHNARKQGADNINEAKLPDAEKLIAANEHTDINDVIIDEVNKTVYLNDPLMTLDVGAVAKGYATEMVARHLEEQGVSGYILNVGGNIRAVGDKPDGKWIAGVENPFSEGEDDAYVAYLTLTSEALVTSGSYQRFYIVDGKNYHHIIDKDTLYPSEYFTSVSVICSSSALADALSTALFSMSYEDGLGLVNSLDGVEALWIQTGGDVVYTDGFARYLTEP